MKDNFSTRSKEYSRYRPTYPKEVYEFMKQHLVALNRAWDCGTGNGQVAVKLSEFFQIVEGSDISANQLKNAEKRDNINYSIQPAENTNFSPRQFDLIISAQAVHWFNFDEFYAEVKRCLNPDGLFVIMGYGLFSSNKDTNKIINYFYNDVIGPYWDEERIYLVEKYKTVPFPFEEIDSPNFEKRYYWDVEHLLGYLRTWSAVKHYVDKHKQDPVELIEKDLRAAFGRENDVVFPILFRLGKLSG